MDIHKIASELSNDPNAVRNWRQIYDALKLSPGEGVNLTKRHDNGQLTNYQLFADILHSWQSANGNQATVQNLETVLRNLGFVAAVGENICFILDLQNL